MAICFSINFFSSGPDYAAAISGTFVPQIPKGTLPFVIGLIGCIIMPHNIYLHSALVLSRKMDTTNKKQLKEANYYNVIESSISLFVAFFINWCVIGTFAYYYMKVSPENFGI